MSEYILELKNITKTFGDFKANDNINLSLRRGEIHALLGENGAGKSTLMNIVFGLYAPTSGKILINGVEKIISNPNIAADNGIGMVHQHFMLIENYTVLQNIILGQENVKKGVIDLKSARERVVMLSRQYGFDIDPDAKVDDITVGMQQRVEILKMLYRDNDVLIFDEPTAVLTPQEIDSLLQIMMKLKNDGKAILLITHKMNEIKAVADRCTVLRKGKYIDTVDVASYSTQQLADLMVGRNVELTIEKTEPKVGESVLVVNNLRTYKEEGKCALEGVTFTAKKGEILCIAGIDGNGQSELVKAICGLIRTKEGNISLAGDDITHASVRERCIAGLAHIPEDRLKFGIVSEGTLGESMILQSYYNPPISKGHILDHGEIRDYTDRMIEEYDIRCPKKDKSNMGKMSGGNQQKAVIAREISRSPKCIFAVQPVRGLDVGAVEFVNKKLIEQRDSGKCVILVSYDLGEVFNLSDRILVMFKGRIVADLNPKDTNLTDIGLYMSGAKKEKEE